MSATAQQAMNMLLGQVITNDVLDLGILNAIAAVSRADFLPAPLAGSAYVDDDLPLGNGRFLIAPMEFARMLKVASITPESSVLIVGGSNGYSAAVVSRLAKRVILCEQDEAMITKAKQRFDAAGITNVTIHKVDSLSEGAPTRGPFNVIILEGAVDRIPTAFGAMLSEGGKLVAAERIAQGGLTQGLARIVEYTKIEGALFRKEWMDTALPLLPGFEAVSEFTF
jgi:protein-L-isoaspartate(D-aspartate) O-methyltransferase